MAKVIHLKTSEWYQLKISLRNIDPLIWRRFAVNSDIKLPDLHKVNHHWDQLCTGSHIS